MRRLQKFVVVWVVVAFILAIMPSQAEARVSISFRPSGDLEFSIAETARTTNALYKVAGWVVRKERHCGDSRLEIWDQQCNPVSGEGPKAVFRTFQTGDPVTLRGRTYTTYSVAKAEVEKLLMKQGFTNVKEGEELYFSAIFKLYQKDASGKLIPMSGEYLTLKDVMGAQEWKVKSGFRQYYDIPVKFTSKNQLYIAYKDKKGQQLASPKLLGEYPAGAYPGPIVLDRVLNHNGAALELSNSWIEYNAQPEPRKRWYEVDDSITKRNITVSYGGTTVVAIYDAEGARVDAKFVDDSGKLLKSDLYIGNYRSGQTAAYTYPLQIASGGHLYELAGSYHTSRADTSRRYFEQSTGEAMSKRQLEVERGGHYFWGVYKKSTEPAITVDLSLHIPHHVDSNKTNVTGTLEALINTNTELDRYELIGLNNISLINPSQKNGSLNGKSRSLSLAVNIPINSSSNSVTASIRVYNKEGKQAEDSVGETILKHASGGSSSMDTSHRTVLAAADRGREKFNVAKGIPGTENLYANVTEAKKYLSDFGYTGVTGMKIYNITVKKSYTKYWEETDNVWGTCELKDSKGKKYTEPCITGTTTRTVYDTPSVVSKTYAIKRPFTYYVADKFALYGIDHAKVNNGSIYGGGVRVDPTGYTPPTADVWHGSSEAEHLQEARIISKSIDLGSTSVHRSSWSGTDFHSGFETAAEQQVGKVLVRNDRIIVNGTTVMSDAWIEEKTAVPGAIPQPGIIGNDVLYRQSIQIPASTKNDVYGSSGYLKYSLVEGLFSPAAQVEFPLGPNPVTVHTPVVNDSAIPDTNRPFDQRMGSYRDMSKPVLVLDRPFTLEFDETALHLPILGYGNRDYKAYTSQKRVQFPFGVYDETGTSFYPAKEWIEIPVGVLKATFKLPTWVNEGDYEVRIQAWAINGLPSDAAAVCQAELNGNRSLNCAERIIDIGVTGRIHSFQITDIGDFRYENVFRTTPGSLVHSGAAYVSGKKDPDGNPIAGREHKWVLPVRKGSHPTQTDTVPHNGYPILFNFKSIGNYWDKGDGVRIEPTFYFVSKDGTKREQVDLFYDAAGEKDKMIRVGSSEDQKLYTRSYVLPAPERNLDEAVLKAAAQYEYYWIMKPAERTQTPWSSFYKEFNIRKTPIGKGYGIEILSYKARTLEGATANLPSGIDATTARRSVQKWHGEYNIPIAPYILPKGTDMKTLLTKYKGVLTGRESEFLNGGYIMVNFDINMVRNNDENTRVLGYQTPFTNMWAIEGLATSSGPFTFKSGDIILFESDFSARNDYDGAGG